MLLRAAACALLLIALAPAQVIEYESGGVKHQTLTRNGVTVMFATPRTHVRDYAMLQVSIANGSQIYSSIKPEDFSYTRADGQTVRASAADEVVKQILDHGNLADVQKLILAYEANLYGIPNMRSTNGYEQRRRGAMAAGVSARFKAAAAASALALVPTRLAPGESTDGAIFFPIEPKLLAGGRLVVHSGSNVYEFNTIQ